MSAGRPDEPHLAGDSEEIRCFRAAVRAWIERAAAEAGRDLREIPPAVLLSQLCANAFSAVTVASAGMTDAPPLAAPPLAAPSSWVVLGDLISAAIDSIRVRGQDRPRSPEDLEREIYWRIEQALAAQDQRAAVLRTEVAEVFAETDALRSALSGAIETGNDRLRNAVISAIDTLIGEFPEMTFLPGIADRGQQDLAAIKHGPPRPARGEAVAAGRGPRWDSGCPYRGLLPFDQEHAGVFCGRQRLMAELIVKLTGRLAGPSMVIVSGASGAGKSSLLHAGLLPALAEGIQLPGSDRWPRIVMTPAGEPLTELATRLAGLSRGDAAAIRDRLAADPDRAHLVVGQAVLDGARQGNGSSPPASVQTGRLVLVVDQFEEVFTLVSSRGDAGQQAFVAALCAAASQPFGVRGEPPAVVVIAVRGDFWVRCAAHAGLATLMQDGMFVVGPMTGTELREAITGPAAAAELQVDADLAETVLADLRTAGQDEAEGILPMLSQAMMLTWGKRDGNRLTVPGYQETGGVARSVEFGAEAVYEALRDAGQQVAKEIFQALVLVGPDGQLVRRAVPRAELVAGRRDAGRRTVGTVLEAFASRRLLVLDGDTVQIAHDVLLRAWPRLRGWLDSEQANWILYTQLQEDAADWAVHERDSSFLYRGSQLAAVKQARDRWAADPDRYPALTHEQSGFLAASNQHAARGARVRRGALLTLVLLLLISAAGAVIATRADKTADQQRNAAVSAQLAAKSETLDATDPVTAALLATAAWRIAPTAEAQTALLDVLAQPTRTAITGAGEIDTITYSQDGKRFATLSGGYAQIGDAATDRETGRPLDIGSAYSSIAFRRDGDVVAISSEPNGPSELWNVTTRSKIGPPITAGGGFDFSIFNPDGTLIATEAPTGETILLDLATRRQIRPSLYAYGPLAFSPNGQILVTALFNGTDQLYDLASKRVIGTVSGASGGGLAAFSPNGKILAASGNNSVSLWDVATRRRLGPPIPIGADALSFSPNGQTLAIMGPAGGTLWSTLTHQRLGGILTPTNTGGLVFSPDNTTLDWLNGQIVSQLNVDVDRQIEAPVGIGNFANSVAFSPQGRVFAEAANNGVARLWNVSTRQATGRPMTIGGSNVAGLVVAFSPNGKILATAGNGSGTQLWTVATQRKIGAPNPGGNGIVQTLAFDPRGQFLAIGGGNGKAWLWDLATGRVSGRPMINGDTYLNAVAFSPDGQILATAQTNEVRLFDVATQHEIGSLLTVAGVNDVAFSPDGSTLATAGSDGAALWNVATHRQIGTPLNAGAVQALAFSPDGTLLATGSQDGTIRLWDVASHEQVGTTLSANSDGILSIAFSPDGSLLATGSQDNEVWIWGAVPTGDLLARACAIAGGSLTPAEWNSYVQSVPYQRTCP